MGNGEQDQFQPREVCGTGQPNRHQILPIFRQPGSKICQIGAGGLFLSLSDECIPLWRDCCLCGLSVIVCFG
jgi:hypothetical protein